MKENDPMKAAALLIYASAILVSVGVLITKGFGAGLICLGLFAIGISAIIIIQGPYD